MEITVPGEIISPPEADNDQPTKVFPVSTGKGVAEGATYYESY